MALVNSGEHERRLSNVDRIVAFFKAHPGEWIEARDLEPFGRQAWRTRVSDARRRCGLRIDQRNIYDPATKRIIRSEYCYIPYEPSLGRDAGERITQKSLF